MPHITKQRLSAEEGIAACRSLCVSAGWLGDTVVSDFGEDLAFQISHKGRVDPFRIYCQVKSYQRLPKTMWLRPEHLRKWLLHIEPVLIVVYDRTAKKLYGAPVTDLFAPFEVEEGAALRTDDLTPLSVDGLNQFAWRTRANVFNYVVRNHDASLRDYLKWTDDGAKEATEAFARHQANELYSLLWFLEYLNVIRRRDGEFVGLKGRRIQRLKTAVRKRLEAEAAPRGRNSSTVIQECILIVLHQWRRAVGENSGLPTDIMLKAAEWLAFLVGIEMRVGKSPDVFRKCKIQKLDGV